MTESINAVIAEYGTTPEFLGIYAQVGAVICRKMPEQLIYVSAEIGQMVERLTGNQFITVNPTRANGNVPLIGNLPHFLEKSSV